LRLPCDGKLAHRLVQEALCGFRSAPRHRITPRSGNWEDIRGLGYPLVDRLGTGDVTVFAVSDDALTSRDCFDDVQHARTRGNYVIYVLVRPLASGTPGA